MLVFLHLQVSYPQMQMDDLKCLSLLVDVIDTVLCSASDSSFMRY